MSHNETTAILVAGMHRSGTSALTGALGAVGITLGDHLLAPGGDNPKGYWEHEEAVGIHERLLASLGRHWDDVRALPEGWQASEAACVASAEIAELISRDFSQSALWAIKDPRICRFLPLWVAATRQLGIRPVVLFVARRPSEVAASIETRNHWAPPIGELLWLRHVLEAEAASRALKRATVIYDDLLAAPEVAISVALNRLGVQCESSSADGHGALRRLVDVSDRHHRHAETKEPCSGFGAIAQTAYEALANTAHGGDTWSALQGCAARFDELWQTSGAPVEAAADMAHQIRLKEAAARLEILDLSSKLNAQIQWSEQAVAIRSELRAEYQLTLDTIVAGRERLASELESASSQAMQERAEHEAAHKALVAEHERLVGELESALSGTMQERAEHEVAREMLAAERERLANELESALSRAMQERAEHEAAREHLAGELESASARVAQQQVEHMTALGALVSERNRLVGELESAAARAIREQAHHATMLDALATERSRLADELESASERATREQARHVEILESLTTERDILARELEAATARSEQERQSHEMHARELVEKYDAEKEALRVARAEVASLNTVVMGLRQSWSWRMTKPLRILGGFFRSKSVLGKR